MKIDIDLGIVASSRLPPKGEKIRAYIDLEELLATRLLVQGNSGSGKSHLLRRLLEKSSEWVQQCIIDPEGDFITLSKKFGHLVIDAGTHSEKELAQISQRIRQRRISVILNLENLDVNQQMKAVAIFLNSLFDIDREFWYPILVVVDEAQIFAPAIAGDISDDIRKICLAAMTNLMCRGRKRGLAGVIATQRLAKLAKNVAAEASNFLMGRTFLDIDMLRAADLLGIERRQAEMFRELQTGCFVSLGPAISKKPISVIIGDVETLPKSTSPKLLPLPLPGAKDHQWVFEKKEIDGKNSITKKTTEQDKLLDKKMIFELKHAFKEDPQEKLITIKDKILNSNLEKVDDRLVCQTILKEMAKEPSIAFQSISAIYQDFLMRCRIYKVRNVFLDLATFQHEFSIVRVAHIFPKAPENLNEEKWRKAIFLSRKISLDIRIIFLVLARAACLGENCPTNEEIAQIYGTHSASRIRRLLEWFEEQNFFIVRTDLSGRRALIFPDLQCETIVGH